METFPAVLPHLSLVLKVTFTQDECDKPHAITFSGQDTAGKPLVGPVTTSVIPRRSPNHPTDDIPFACVFNMRDVPLASPGPYAFSVRVGEIEVQTLRLLAASVTEATLRATAVNTSQPVLRSEGLQVPGSGRPQRPGEVVAVDELRVGYRAFVEGRLSEAEAAFRQVAERAPNFAQAPNNLGFVLLCEGRAEEALSWFDRAAELKYHEPEVLNANRACAKYALGDYRSAYTGFVDCLASARIRLTTLLLAIDGRNFNPIELGSAGDYAALMALNAGWSAREAGESAEDLIRVASLGRISFRDKPNALIVFERCLEHLEAAGS
jgi:hypothetical protein